MSIEMSRRSFFSAAGLITAAAVASNLNPSRAAAATKPAVAAKGPVLEAEGIRVYLGDDGILHVLDGTGVERLKIHKVYLTGKIGGMPTASKLITVDGRDALEIEFGVKPSTPDVDVTGYECHGILIVGDGGTLSLDVDLTAPTEFSTAAPYTQITRSYAPFDAYKETTSVPVSTWTTDERGGIPFQSPLGTVYTTPLGEDIVCHELAIKNNAEWVGDWNFHLPATKIDDTHWTMNYAAIVGTTPRSAAGAQLVTSDLMVGATTEQPFHLWIGEKATPEFDLTVTQKAAARDVVVEWNVRDFDGTVVGEGRETLSGLEGIGTLHAALGSAVPRGSYFLSVTATAGEETAIARLTLSVLPAWTNPVDADGSKFGLAALFMKAGAGYSVSREDWLSLVQRLGVRHIRQYQQMEQDELAQAGIRGMFHRGPTQGQLRIGGTYPEGELDTAARDRLFDEYALACQESGAPYFELSNEWNMKGGILSGTTAAEYVHDLLLPMHDYLVERDIPTQLCIMGLAGPDYVWLEKLAAEDDGAAWKATGAVALHTGRGNFTPDFAPGPDDWTSGSSGTYWNNEGSVLAIKNTIAQLDEKYDTHHELLITETYAVTYANHWWSDGFRNGAENVLLTIALAHKDDVDSFYWYQLSDGVWWSIDGINPDDKEFSYGMVMVDGSLKPTAVAFATAAEHLSGATFVQEHRIGPDDAEGHALVFDGPQGSVQVLWSRADGYILHADHEDLEDGYYDMPEPWVDEWPTKTAVNLPAEGDVTEIDCLGRKTLLPNSGGSVRVVLDGAPRIYYGLSLPQEPEQPADWASDQRYTGGDRVSCDGAVWEASWWSQDEKPGSTWGPWQEIAQASDGTAVWKPTRIFTSGDVVEHDGARYVAQWWTRNQEPTGELWTAWKRQS